MRSKILKKIYNIIYKMKKIETERDPKIGNTNEQSSGKENKKKQSCQLKYWFFTWNNYPLEGENILLQCFDRYCNRYQFQEEKGESGTKHLQGCIELKKAMRWTELKLPSSIHWEKTNNIESAFNYCIKNETNNGKRWIYPEPVKTLESLYIWQIEAKNILLKKSNDRTIYWFFDIKGNKGKSQFIKYLVINYNGAFLDAGTKRDLINLIFNTDMNKCKLVLLDICRSEGNEVNYSAIESIKNGLVCNTKYETGFKAFNSPQIAIFSNYPPITESLSTDRWKIYEIVSICEPLKEYKINNL